MFNWGISKVVFSGGETITLEPSSVLIFVGPNSGGKTSSIRGIEAQIHMPTNPKTTISEVELFVEGTEEDLREWLSSYYHTRETTDGINYLTVQATLRSRQIPSIWQQLSTQQRSGEALNFLFKRLDTETRLHIGNEIPSLTFGSIEPRGYLHVLQSNDKLLQQVSSEVRNNFGFNLIINWGGGGQVWFNVGNEPNRTRERDRVSLEYLTELNQLPRLEYEGDGIRSFVGTLLAALCAAYKVILIDEPEAFLHPPQARRLANLLARSALDYQRQVIIATHSSEVIQGVLDITPKVTICRVTREGNLNHGAQLHASDIRSLWSKPLLSSASAIDGVFYDGVVVCEADTDNRFYDAASKHALKQLSFDKPPYFYFVHGGGKGALPILANTYRSLQVPVAVIADFDVLRQKGQFQAIVAALGGTFEELLPLYNITVSALNEIPPIKSASGFVTEAQALLQEIQLQGSISSANRQTLFRLLDDTKAWSEAKKYGVMKLKGGAHQACIDLLSKCSAIGLFIVPSGELESWWRGGPSGKVDWSNASIERIAENPALFRDAIEFIATVARFLTSKS